MFLKGVLLSLALFAALAGLGFLGLMMTIYYVFLFIASYSLGEAIFERYLS